jgi:hypothetical protein
MQCRPIHSTNGMCGKKGAIENRQIVKTMVSIIKTKYEVMLKLSNPNNN